MTKPIELFNSWRLGGVMTWRRKGWAEPMETPLVLLYQTQGGFLAVPPGYQLPLPEPHERQIGGPLEVDGRRLVFPEGEIVDLEKDGDLTDTDVQRWLADIAAKGRTPEQEREHYKNAFYPDLITD